MMNKDPKGRPTAIEVLRDPFIKSHMEVKIARVSCGYNQMFQLGLCPQRLNTKLTQKLDSTRSDQIEAVQAIARAL